MSNYGLEGFGEVVTVIPPEGALGEVDGEGGAGDAIELGESPLCKRPEGFDAIDAWSRLWYRRWTCEQWRGGSRA